MIEAGKRVRLPSGQIGVVFAYLSDGRAVVTTFTGHVERVKPSDLRSVVQFGPVD